MVKIAAPAKVMVRGGVLVFFALASAPLQARCTGMLEPAMTKMPSATRAHRKLVARDLLQMRDLGPADGSMVEAPSPLAVSPDARRVAFILRRADTGTNSYCRALVVLSLDGRDRPKILDQGGEYISDMVALYGRRIANGFPRVISPHWSPDGRYVAYLRRDRGVTQVWVAHADGSGARAVTHSRIGVEGVTWDKDGQGLVYTERSQARALAALLAREAGEGWLYDDRFAPQEGLAPQLPETPLHSFRIDPQTLAVSQAHDVDPNAVRNGSALQATLADGRLARVGRREGSPFGPQTLAVTGEDGAVVNCRDPACQGDITGVWGEAADAGVIFLRREGWARERMGLYRWSGRAGNPPVSILKTNDVLLGCRSLSRGLVCTRENAVTPRRIAIVDTQSGAIRDIFDPNPEFRELDLGSVERLHWKNANGFEVRGDLALPPGYRKGRLPLIVVQYRSDGFLRGGTGDEYPIQAFAAQGFAVLSIERPVSVAANRSDVTTLEQYLSALTRDWSERRSLLSAFVVGVDKLIARGIADPRRIGITGLSDGASTVRFALINTDMFAAASISSCCVDEDTLTYAGPALARQFMAMGYPAPGDPARAFWRPYSLARNAARIDRPLLMQLSDDEALIGIHAFTALHQAGQPVELYIFADEHHMKWQPAHRAAVYRRNLDWFAFWLQDREDPVPEKRSQYVRWEALRAAQARAR